MTDFTNPLPRYDYWRLKTLVRVKSVDSDSAVVPSWMYRMSNQIIQSITRLFVTWPSPTRDIIQIFRWRVLNSRQWKLGRSRSRWKENVKTEFKNKGCGLQSTDSGKGFNVDPFSWPDEQHTYSHEWLSFMQLDINLMKPSIDGLNRPIWNEQWWNHTR
jgi:hypothetical protein